MAASVVVMVLSDVVVVGTVVVEVAPLVVVAA